MQISNAELPTGVRTMRNNPDLPPRTAALIEEARATTKKIAVLASSLLLVFFLGSDASMEEVRLQLRMMERIAADWNDRLGAEIDRLVADLDRAPAVLPSHVLVSIPPEAQEHFSGSQVCLYLGGTDWAFFTKKGPLVRRSRSQVLPARTPSSLAEFQSEWDDLLEGGDLVVPLELSPRAVVVLDRGLGGGQYVVTAPWRAGEADDECRFAPLEQPVQHSALFQRHNVKEPQLAFNMYSFGSRNVSGRSLETWMASVMLPAKFAVEHVATLQAELLSGVDPRAPVGKFSDVFGELETEFTEWRTVPLTALSRQLERRRDSQPTKVDALGLQLPLVTLVAVVAFDLGWKVLTLLIVLRSLRSHFAYQPSEVSSQWQRFLRGPTDRASFAVAALLLPLAANVAATAAVAAAEMPLVVLVPFGACALITPVLCIATVREGWKLP